MRNPRKPATQFMPRIARGIVPTTAIASGLLSQASSGSPGDLDPTFGDMGRVGPALNLQGPAWSAATLTGDESLIAGGEAYVDYYCSYYDSCFTDGFIGQVSPSGSLDLEFAAQQLKLTQVIDFALQPDGKVVAVGSTYVNGTTVLTVFRALASGALDTTFAEKGVLEYGTDSNAQSVALDPSGAIVVGGSSGGKLVVLRLLANGSSDPSFGTGGVYAGPATDGSSRIHLLRTASGGYRVSTNFSASDPQQPSYCGVLALTGAGTLDPTYGTSGIAAINASPGSSISCPAMASQSDGSLLLAGQNGDQGFVSHLLTSGVPDPNFAASAVQANMSDATALAVDATGAILVAGQPNAGVPGALIIRLQASGALDDLFGDNGSTSIDLLSSAATNPVIYDMSILPDGRILAAGGESPTHGTSSQPLLVRLLGTTGTAGPGVIGVTPSSVAVKEQDKTAVVSVRRMGGASGSVSVSYQTAVYTGTDAPPATSGTDYTPVSGQLSWADGDRTDRQITVPILTDGRVEEPKRFTVMLNNATGGSEFGTQAAVVEVATDGDRAGELGFAQPTITASQAAGSAQIVVNRNYYSTGSISVTLTPVAGTATSADFSTAPITLSWADGDSQPKTAAILISENVTLGPGSTFTVNLTNPTNGAVIGPQSHELVTITPTSPPPSSGGGGALDWLSLVCLGWIRWLQRRKT